VSDGSAVSGSPSVLGNAFDVAAVPDDGRGGALWNLSADPRQLDSNIIRIPSGDRIDAPSGADLDVLVLVLSGSGAAEIDSGELSLEPGALVWLPRGARRTIIASDGGLTYLTVHTRRPPLTIGFRPPTA
jgi:hypothetical protein